MTHNPARHRIARRLTGIALALTCGIAAITPASAQQAAPLLDDDALVDLVAPVALYPDDLLAIVLPASTYPLQVVEAARFLDDRIDDPTLEPDPAWDDSVVALLNYPEALALLNDDLDWTWRLGEAVLAQQGDVLEAVEVFRDQAWLAGNLKTDDYQVVERGSDGIAIRPADPEVVYVPYYDPAVVVVRSAWPVYHYHPFAYPLYYYPYPVGHRFYSGFFWGVSTAFAISWHDRFLHLRYFDHVGHPYYGRRFVANRFYRLRRFADHRVYRDGVRVVHRQGQAYRWHPRRGHGARPGYRRFEGRDRTTLRYGDRGVRPGARASRAARVNRERQRYRTFDNNVDRERRNARRQPARERRNAGAGNRRDPATGNTRNGAQRFASDRARAGATRRGTPEAGSTRLGTARGSAERRSQRPTTRRGTTRGADTDARQQRRATPGATRFASRQATPRRNAERPARSAPAPRRTERRAAPYAERSSRGRAVQPAPRSERQTRSRVQTAPRAERRSTARASRGASRSAPRASRSASRGGRDGGNRGRRSRRN